VRRQGIGRPRGSEAYNDRRQVRPPNPAWDNLHPGTTGTHDHGLAAAGREVPRSDGGRRQRDRGYRAGTLFLATGLGIPVSATHTITGAIIGVGSVKKLSAVRWGVAERIVWAWVLTIPCTAFISALAWRLARHVL
jgi:hypothetical protein